MMMIVEQSVECELAGETELLGETCLSASLSTTNPTRADLGSNPGRRGGNPATDSLSYGAAKTRSIRVTEAVGRKVRDAET
jgi:hypothetical protein